MLANIAIVTKQATFPSGTIGAGWLWKMVEVKSGTKTEWTTDASSTQAEVVEGLVYEVCGVRVDPNNDALGSQLCTQFTATIGNVVIDVADTISVSVS